MPTIETVHINVKDLMPGDVITGVTSSDVVTGKRVAQAMPTVKLRKLRKTNTEIVTTGNETILIQTAAFVFVDRAVPTEEEAAAEAARKQAVRLEYLQHDVFNNAVHAYNSVAHAKQSLAKIALEESPYLVGEKLVDAAAAVHTAEVAWSFWHRVLDGTGWNGQDIVHSAKQAIDNLTHELAFGYTDDTWSGRLRNDLNRMKADTQRDILRSMTVSSVLYFFKHEAEGK